MSSVTFLVPCYNNEKTVVKTLKSIESQSRDIEKDVVLVDDGSLDNSVNLIDEFSKNSGLKIAVLRKQNKGEASALNCGLDYSRGEYIAIVEADVELKEDWLDFTMQEFTSEDIMGVGGYLKVSPEDPWISRIAGYEIEDKLCGQKKQAKHISSANALYRRKAFEVAGRFNEGLINASLDADFNQRLIDSGYRLIFCPKAQVVHHYKDSLSGYLKRQYAYARYRIYLKGRDLYPQDIILSANVILCAGLFLLPVLFLFSPALTFYYFIFVILFQLPQAIKIYSLKKDRVLFAFPFIIILRNLVAAFGCFIGALEKARGGRNEK